MTLNLFKIASSSLCLATSDKRQIDREENGGVWQGNANCSLTLNQWENSIRCHRNTRGEDREIERERDVCMYVSDAKHLRLKFKLKRFP